MGRLGEEPSPCPALAEAPLPFPLSPPAPARGSPTFLAVLSSVPTLRRVDPAQKPRGFLWLSVKAKWQGGVRPPAPPE